MKPSIHPVFIFLAFLSFIFFESCSDSETDVVVYQEVKFNFSNDRVTSSKSGRLERIDPVQADKVRFSIISAQGDSIHKQSELDLTQFGENFTSDPIALPVGNYQLVEYMIISESGNVTYATPIEGSELAHLVVDPLAIEFDVIKDEVTELSPEVISTEGFSPVDFGYSQFSFTVQEVFRVLVALFAKDETGTAILTEGEFQATSGQSFMYDVPLIAGTNEIILPEEFDNEPLIEFTLQVTKNGYQDYAEVFSLDSIAKYENEPLIITLEEIEFVAPTQGLVLHYSFEGNLEDQLAIRNGRSVNGDVSFVDGRKGQALKMPNILTHADNSHRVEVEPWAPGNMSFTVSAWFLINDQTELFTDRFGIKSAYLFYYQPDIILDSYNLGVATLDGENMYATTWIDTPGGAGATSVESARNIKFTEWNHLSYTVDQTQGTLTLFVNGEEADSQSFYEEIILNPSIGFIGGTILGDNAETRYRTSGITLDEIRIYDRVLSIDEIRTLANE